MKIVAIWTWPGSFDCDGHEEIGCFNYESPEKFLQDLENALKAGYQDIRLKSRTQSDWLEKETARIKNLPQDEQEEASHEMMMNCPKGHTGFIEFAGRTFEITDYVTKTPEAMELGDWFERNAANP